MEFKIEEVLSVACAAHRMNNGFIKKDQVRFDKKHEKSTCNSDLLYNYFFTDKKFDIIEGDKALANEVKEYFTKAWGEMERGSKWSGYRVRTLQDDIGDSIQNEIEENDSDQENE